MNSFDLWFMTSAEQAIHRSLREKKTLFVYNTNGNDDWLMKWLTLDIAENIKEKTIWLKLTEGTDQFKYFQHFFSDVTIPSVYCIQDGKIVMLLHENDDIKTFPLKLMDCIGVETLNNSLDEHKDTNTKLLKNLNEQISETPAQKYHQKMAKQKRLDQEERARIIKLVKADREECSSNNRFLKSENNYQNKVHENIKHPQLLRTNKCGLIIRLMDGENIKHEFSHKDTLNDVRKWVDSNRTDGDMPYQFYRSIPRVIFLELEELKTLEELGLTPRSALILKPIEINLSGRKVAKIQGPGLLERAYQTILTWWKAPVSTSKPVSSYRDMPSQGSSQYSSPLLSPTLTHIDSSHSNLDLPSRAVSPNIHQLVNNQDDFKQKHDFSNYNGNTINLEDKKD